MFNYIHSFVRSFDMRDDEERERERERERDKYPCRVSDTFVYLAPCYTSPSSSLYCLIKMSCIYRHGIVLQYADNEMITKHTAISTF